MFARTLLIVVLAGALGLGPTVAAGAQDSPGGATTVPAPAPSLPAGEQGVPSAPAEGADSSAATASPPPAINLAAMSLLAELRRDEAIALASQQADALEGIALAALGAAEQGLASAGAVHESLGRSLEEAHDGIAAAAGDLEREQDLADTLAVEAYTVAGTSADVLGRARLDALEGAGAEVSATLAYAGASRAVLDRRLAAAGARHAEAVAEAERRGLALRAAQADLDAARARVDDRRRDLEGARIEGERLVTAARAGGGVVSGASSLSILGPTLVGPGDLAAFVRARGTPHPSVDVEALAAAFVEEGVAQGVRADVAWVQSVLETGWFSFANSMVSPADFNYAGIGACDSCTSGFDFPSPALGARAQMQLLATYATPGLVSAQLAHPPVRLRPERSSVRGCCSTWMTLSGVWATGTGYGAKILELYNELLAFALERRGVVTTEGGG